MSSVTEWQYEFDKMLHTWDDEEWESHRKTIIDFLEKLKVQPGDFFNGGGEYSITFKPEKAVEDIDMTRMDNGI